MAQAVDRGNDQADIKKYVNEDASLTNYAIEKWHEYTNRHNPDIPKCCGNTGNYTLSLTALLAAGHQYPNLEIRTAPAVILYCNSCGRMFSFAAHIVFPELHTILQETHK